MMKRALSFAGLLAPTLVCVWPSTVTAQTKPARVAVTAAAMETVTFSRIVLRLHDSTDIRVSGEELRVRVLEELRRSGYPALGAESLVFDKDDADRARMVLGATATDIQCEPQHFRAKSCQLTMVWEVLNRPEDRVVYRVTTRAVAEGQEPAQLGEELVWGNFHSLLSRQRFVDVLKKRPPSRAPSPHAKASFARCQAGARPMPESTPQLIRSTVLLQSGNSVGTGAVVSPDGFILTAAHLVDSAEKTTAQLQDGSPISAVVVRRDTQRDVALLRVSSGSAMDCIPLAYAPGAAGSDVFAIGSPLGKALSFSITRGIVSGQRTIDGVDYLQTDASVNRGNSGGPLVNREGALLGVVSWKVAGAGVEGIGFGVPVWTAMDALAIAPGDVTTALLKQEVVTGELPRTPTFVDVPDADWRAPKAPVEEATAERLPPVEPGLEFGVRGDFGGRAGEEVRDRDLLAGIGLDAGYRLAPSLFLGLFFHYGIVVDEEEGRSASNLRVGLQGQVHILPSASFDPWVGVGFGYEILWRGETETAYYPSRQTWSESSTYTGFEWLHLQAGGDVRTSIVGLSVGPVVGFSAGKFNHLRWERDMPDLGPNSMYPFRDGDTDLGVPFHYSIMVGIRGSYVL